jgi:ACS family allantoate permease-like MFS transporter
MPDTAPLHKWQYLYLITGSINVLFSIFLIVALPDSPLNAFFLTKEEKYHAIVRLASNRTGVGMLPTLYGSALSCLMFM